jgi:hypothetical protein
MGLDLYFYLFFYDIYFSWFSDYQYWFVLKIVIRHLLDYEGLYYSFQAKLKTIERV